MQRETEGCHGGSGFAHLKEIAGMKSSTLSHLTLTDSSLRLELPFRVSFRCLEIDLTVVETQIVEQNGGLDVVVCF